MRFFTYIFSFPLVLNYVATESFVEYIFSAMPLSHSGFLISWKPNITIQRENIYEDGCILKFETYIVGEKYKNKNTSVHRSDEISAFDRQYKIHSLMENTFYEIIIKQLIGCITHFKTYSVKKRTNVVSKRTPAKPYFEYMLGERLKDYVTIKWYPCGKERVCHDQESGTHFGIKIREPYSNRRISEVRKDELFKDRISISFWAGKMYELVVYSVNGEFLTDSDPQEIYLKPTFTQVQHVNVISLPDSSILISWKPPKQSLDNAAIRGYRVMYFNFSQSNTDKIDHILFKEDFIDISKYQDIQVNIQHCEQKRIFDLIPEAMYTISITPLGDVGIGFEYRMEYKHRSYNQNLQIAKPDFNYIFELEDNRCKFHFLWLPCGKSFDCKATIPGSNYTFQFKPEAVNRDQGYYNYDEYGYYFGILDSAVEYFVTIKSSFGNRSSESETKMFKNCREIRENKQSVARSEF